MRPQPILAPDGGLPERALGFLSSTFSEEELTKMDLVLLELISDEELALWYDLPVMSELEHQDLSFLI